MKIKHLSCLVVTFILALACIVLISRNGEGEATKQTIPPKKEISQELDILLKKNDLLSEKSSETPTNEEIEETEDKAVGNVRVESNVIPDRLQSNEGSLTQLRRRHYKKSDLFEGWPHPFPEWTSTFSNNTEFLFQYPDPEHIKKYFPDAFMVATIPRTYYFPNFLSSEEVEHMIELARPILFRSKVQESADAEAVSDIRTSSQAWIREDSSPIVQAVFERIKFVTGIHVAEQLQVLNYQVGQKYVYHFDYLPGNLPTQRAATFFLYLSDVEGGGHTAFPDAEGVGADRPSCCEPNNPSLKVKAIRGNAILWYNLERDGKRSPHALHSGCPILAGEKWAANVWLRVRNTDPYF